ncbi:O-antigen ligase family protein [Novosphingopyxis sp.]|uniref:O-antigen ligase family protein n=1 Tax=Novosphingopyxis sp. TaxID=2709690 RepID=UPI003B5B0119
MISSLKRILNGVLLPVYLSICLLLGGASTGGIIANTILQLLAVAILAYHFWAPSTETAIPKTKVILGLYWLIALYVCWTIVQMIPLPPSMWHALPGREFIERGDAMLGMSDVWRPIAMQPDRAIISAMAILPPFAMLVLTLRADRNARAAGLYALMAIAILSSIIGLIQISHGADSPAYFYDITNRNTSVGFFSNSNHLGMLFLIALVFTSDLPFRDVPDRSKLFWLAVRTGLMLFMLVNVLINRSFAAYVLLIPALAFWFARTKLAKRFFGQTKTLIAGLFIILSCLCLVGFTWGARLLDHLTLNSTSVSERLRFLDNTGKLIADTIPVGSGLGSFRWLYAGNESLAAVTRTYVNHAHNDYAEFLTEGGFFAVILFGGLIGWLGWRLWSMLRAEARYLGYCYAAPIVILLVAGHSLVDYPVRTAAIAAICGMCLGFLAKPDLIRRAVR